MSATTTTDTNTCTMNSCLERECNDQVRSTEFNENQFDYENNDFQEEDENDATLLLFDTSPIQLQNVYDWLSLRKQNLGGKRDDDRMIHMNYRNNQDEDGFFEFINRDDKQQQRDSLNVVDDDMTIDRVNKDFCTMSVHAHSFDKGLLLRDIGRDDNVNNQDDNNLSSSNSECAETLHWYQKPIRFLVDITELETALKVALDDIKKCPTIPNIIVGLEDERKILFFGVRVDGQFWKHMIMLYEGIKIRVSNNSLDHDEEYDHDTLHIKDEDSILRQNVKAMLGLALQESRQKKMDDSNTDNSISTKEQQADPDHPIYTRVY